MINAEFVEKALLGTLLNDPTRRSDVPWLEVGDFTNPLCRALWDHLEKGSPPDFSYPLDYVRLSDALHTEADIHPCLTSPAEVAALQMGAPAHPDAAAYGRILVEVAIRSQLHTIGLKLGSATEQTAPLNLAHSGAVEALKELKDRWQHVGRSPSSDAVGGSRAVTGMRLPEPESVRLHELQIEPPDRDLAAAETAVLGSALHDRPKGSRSLLMAHIHPSDFSDPRAAATFHAAQQLDCRGGHVDEITVRWQLTRNQSNWGPGLELAELTRDRFTGQLDPRDIRTVTTAAQRRALVQASATVTSEAQNLATDLSTTTTRVSESLNEVARDSRRHAERPHRHVNANLI